VAVIILSSFLPELRISRSSFDRRLENKALVTVVNSVVGSVRSGDQILRIENPFLTPDEIIGCNRVHVVNQQPAVDVVARNAKVASAVSKYD